MSTKRKRHVVTVDLAEIEALLARVEPKITKADHEKLTAMAATLVEVARLVRDERATNARLRQMLGQTSSEKTAAVLGADANGTAPGATNDSATTTTEGIDSAARGRDDSERLVEAGQRHERRGRGRQATRQEPRAHPPCGVRGQRHRRAA